MAQPLYGPRQNIREPRADGIRLGFKAGRICNVCGQGISANKLAQASHGRMHVREGRAVQVAEFPVTFEVVGSEVELSQEEIDALSEKYGHRSERDKRIDASGI